MRLISDIFIKNFRSIKNLELVNLSEFVSISGQNNAGKSNVLKALNLFFNDETDPGRKFDLEIDYNKYQQIARRKKTVMVGAKFTLPDFFEFRTDLAHVKSLLGSKNFEITKVWTRDSPDPQFFLNNIAVDTATISLLKFFLALIRFRYIPNRVLPIDIIRSEHRAIKDSLVRRLRATKTGDTSVFEQIQEKASTLLGNLEGEYGEIISEFKGVKLATPQEWGDVIFNLGYRVQAGKRQVDDEYQGSGVQSILMLETLALVDQDFYKQFGWKQANIWGFEEPESSLHYSLESLVGHKLSELAKKAAARLQIFATTHSNILTQYSGTKFYVQRVDGETRCSELKEESDFEEVWTAGVSPWLHPLLRFPNSPLILVEGKTDAIIFDMVKGLVPNGLNFRVSYLGQLEKSDADGGDERLLQYVQNNRAAIEQRSEHAPVVIILDWDSAKKIDKFRKVSNSKGYVVKAWSEGDMNPKLSAHFRGIERAYSTEFVEKVCADSKIPLVNKAGVLAVHIPDYAEFKKKAIIALTKNPQLNAIEKPKLFLTRICKEVNLKLPETFL